MATTTVVAAGLLVAASAFFSGSEIAVFSLRTTASGASPTNRAATSSWGSARTPAACW